MLWVCCVVVVVVVLLLLFFCLKNKNKNNFDLSLFVVFIFLLFVLIHSGSFFLPFVCYTFFFFSDDWQSGTTEAEIKVPSVENPELANVLPLNPGICQNIATHASPTANLISSLS